MFSTWNIANPFFFALYPNVDPTQAFWFCSLLHVHLCILLYISKSRMKNFIPFKCSVHHDLRRQRLTTETLHSNYLPFRIKSQNNSCTEKNLFKVEVIQLNWKQAYWFSSHFCLIFTYFVFHVFRGRFQSRKASPEVNHYC